MDDDQITPDELITTLAKALTSVAESAGVADEQGLGSGAARDYAEAAERLASALTEVRRTKNP
jgi:hypothetical protein